MLDLRSAITTTRRFNTEVDMTTLERFLELLGEHQVRWLPNSEGSEVWFVMSDIAVAKGLSKDDYFKHWSDRALVRASEKGIPSESLPGVEFTIEGERLKHYKERFLAATGVSLGRINSLTVGSWKRAYYYAIQGSSSVAKDFSVLGSDTIEKQIVQDVKTKVQYSFPLTEDEIQMRLVWISSRCNQFQRFESEKTFPTLDSEGTRRFDLYRWQPVKKFGKKIEAVELKANIVTEFDVYDKVEHAKYLDILKGQSQDYKLTFVAPFGATEEAQWQIQTYQAQGLNVDWMPLSKYTHDLITQAIRNHPNDSFVIKEMRSCEALKPLLNPATALNPFLLAA